MGRKGIKCLGVSKLDCLSIQNSSKFTLDDLSGLAVLAYLSEELALPWCTASDHACGL